MVQTGELVKMFLLLCLILIVGLIYLSHHQGKKAALKEAAAKAKADVKEGLAHAKEAQ